MTDEPRTAVTIDPFAGLPQAYRRRGTATWTDAAGQHTCTPEERVVIGSAAEAGIRVEDPAVSRLHAGLELRDDGLWIRDLSSRNGTYVDGVLVGEARLHDGCQIRIGVTTMQVHYEGRETAVDLWPFDRFGPLVGRSVPMRQLFARIARFAPSESRVLIQGETGTGKEVVARAIHEASARAGGPFVVVDCAAMPASLIEDELFGHQRGAFTGAHASRPGAIEEAEGGTAFIDEIGELPLHLQPKLLRLIETGQVSRLGDTESRKVDVRFLAATHRDLRTMVNTGVFREDLYFRIAVLPIAIPSLRERVEDIPLLVDRFLPPGVSPLPPAVIQELIARPWPGNVRELRNFVERALVLGPENALDLGDRMAAAPAISGLPEVPLDRSFKDVREGWLDHLEREYVRGILARHGGNISAASQAAGLNRTYVHRLIRKHGL